MPNTKVLTTKEVARLCCVSDATVKRWNDLGLIRSQRTNGGHRRFKAEDVARFQLEQNLGLKQSHGDETFVTAASRRRENKYHSDSSLFHALIAGCEEEAAGILINNYLHNNSLSPTFDNLIAPAMQRIGDLWYKGELTVAHEHLATRTAICALSRLRSVVPVCNPNGNIAVCLAFEGDFHELPVHLTQMILESEGWEVINYGCNLPLYTLCDEISHHSPDVICIAATVISDIERLSRDYRNFRDKLCRTNTPVILGGLAFQDTIIRKRFPSELYAANFDDALQFTRKLLASQPN